MQDTEVSLLKAKRKHFQDKYNSKKRSGQFGWKRCNVCAVLFGGATNDAIADTEYDLNGPVALRDYETKFDSTRNVTKHDDTPERIAREAAHYTKGKYKIRQVL